MLWLLSILACISPRPPTEATTTTPLVTPNPCYDTCLQQNQARAVSWDQVERDCRAQCETSGEVQSGGDIPLKSGDRVTISGTLVRHVLHQDREPGTAIRLDDGTLVWLTYGAPPPGFAVFMDKKITVVGLIWDGPPPDFLQSIGAPHLSDWAVPQPAKP